MNAQDPCAVYAGRWPALAAGDVDPTAAVHVAGCATCAAELARWRIVAAGVRTAVDTTPDPSPALLDGVWSRLDDRMPSPARRVSAALRHAGLVLVAQVPLVRRRLWVASAVVMAIGGMLGGLAGTPEAAAGLLGVLAPVIAAVGLALVYGPEVDPCLELALATPTSPRSVLLARMTLVFGYDLGLALGANALVTVLRGDVTWWALISHWLGPMLLLASLALLLSVTVGPGTAIGAALSLWTVRLITLTQAGRALADGAARMVVDVVWSTGVVTVACSAVVLLCAVVAAGRRERLA